MLLTGSSHTVLLFSRFVPDNMAVGRGPSAGSTTNEAVPHSHCLGPLPLVRKHPGPRGPPQRDVSAPFKSAGIVWEQPGAHRGLGTWPVKKRGCWEKLKRPILTPPHLAQAPPLTDLPQQIPHPHSTLHQLGRPGGHRLTQELTQSSHGKVS